MADTFPIPTDPTAEWAADLAASVGLENKWPDGGAGLAAYIMGSTAEARSLAGRIEAAIKGGLFGATSFDYSAGWLGLAEYVRAYYPENVFRGATKLAATYAAAGGAEEAYANPATHSSFVRWLEDKTEETVDKLTDWKTVGATALGLGGLLWLFSRK